MTLTSSPNTPTPSALVPSKSHENDGGSVVVAACAQVGFGVLLRFLAPASGQHVSRLLTTIPADSVTELRSLNGGWFSARCFQCWRVTEPVGVGNARVLSTSLSVPPFERNDTFLNLLTVLLFCE